MSRRAAAVAASPGPKAVKLVMASRVHWNTVSRSVPATVSPRASRSWGSFIIATVWAMAAWDSWEDWRAANCWSMPELEAVPIAEACRFAVKMHAAAVGTASYTRARVNCSTRSLRLPASAESSSLAAALCWAVCTTPGPSVVQGPCPFSPGGVQTGHRMAVFLAGGGALLGGGGVGLHHRGYLVDAVGDLGDGHVLKSSEEISKIIATIENIAFQTNILALNANPPHRLRYGGNGHPGSGQPSR